MCKCLLEFLCLPVGPGEQDTDIGVHILRLLLSIKEIGFLAVALQSQMPSTHILELGEGHLWLVCGV